jgi:hypothetical protein
MIIKKRNYELLVLVQQIKNEALSTYPQLLHSDSH